MEVLKRGRSIDSAVDELAEREQTCTRGAQAYYDRCPDVRHVPAKRTALGFPVCPAHGLPAPASASTPGSAASGGFQGVLLAGMRERDDPLSDERPTQYDLAIVQCGAAGQPLQVGNV